MMNTKTLDALKASIVHWQENLAKAKAGERFELGPSECALCRLFFFVGDCDGCPVKDKTGYGGCVGTPYHKVRSVLLYRRQSGDDLAEATKDEVEFLQSLLPPGALP